MERGRRIAEAILKVATRNSRRAEEGVHRREKRREPYEDDGQSGSLYMRKRLWLPKYSRRHKADVLRTSSRHDCPKRTRRITPRPHLDQDENRVVSGEWSAVADPHIFVTSTWRPDMEPQISLGVRPGDDEGLSAQRCAVTCTKDNKRT